MQEYARLAGSSAKIGLDAADVNPIDDLSVQEIGNSAIRMDLGNGVRAIEALLQGIRFKSLDKELISNSIVVRSAALILAEIVLVNKGLSLGSKQVNVHNNRNREQHVSTEDKCARTNIRVEEDRIAVVLR